MLDRQLKYIQARLAIMRYIAEHDLVAGDRLPTTRTLFAQFDHSAASIRRALADMESAGMIERRQGSGTYLKQPVKHAPFQWHILYLSFCQKGTIPHSSLQNDCLRYYLARHGIGLIVRSVFEVDLEVVEASTHSLGIMVFGWCDDQVLQELQKLNKPIIVVGNTRFSLPLPNITLDMELGAYRLTKTMLEDGLKDILLIRGDDDYLVACQAEQGYRSAMSEAGLPVQTIRATARDSYDEVISRYMSVHPDTQGILMEHSTFFEFIAWSWRTGYQRHPAIGFLSDPYEISSYRPSRQFMGLRFADISLKAAEVLLHQIIDGIPMTSCTLPPFIPGVDGKPAVGQGGGLGTS